MKNLKNNFVKLFVFLLFSIIVLQSIVFTQSDTIEKNHLGISYSLDQINQVNSSLKTRKMSGFTTGLTLKHNFNRKFDLNSSLVFSVRNFETYDITLSNSINPQTGIDSTFTLNKNYQSIEIPIYFQYNIVSTENLKVYPFAGTTLNFYLNSTHVWKSFNVNNELIYTIQTRYKGAGGSYFELGKLIGLGVSYNFNEKWNFALNIIARMYEYNKNAGSYTTSNGVNFQLFYHL